MIPQPNKGRLELWHIATYGVIRQYLPHHVFFRIPYWGVAISLHLAHLFKSGIFRWGSNNFHWFHDARLRLSQGGLGTTRKEWDFDDGVKDDGRVWQLWNVHSSGPRGQERTKLIARDWSIIVGPDRLLPSLLWLYDSHCQFWMWSRVLQM